MKKLAVFGLALSLTACYDVATTGNKLPNKHGLNLVADSKITMTPYTEDLKTLCIDGVKYIAFRTQDNKLGVSAKFNKETLKPEICKD